MRLPMKHEMYPAAGPYELTTGRYTLWCTCGFRTQDYVHANLARKMLERHIEQAQPPVYGAGPGYN